MATTLVSSAGSAAEADPIWRLTVEQYHAMINAGIVREDSPVELVEGILFRKLSKNPPHRFASVRLQRASGALLPAGWDTLSQDPITLTASEPEPDIVVIRGSNADYPDRHPGPGDVALVIEVAEASLAYDRGIKKVAYASAGIPVYWIVNLIDRQIEIHTDPRGETYQSVSIIPASGMVPLVIAGANAGSIPAASILP
jgi:Uma2 family endonuclease